MTSLIIAEKPSAAKNFAKALGGREGTFEGTRYKIASLRGHLLELAPPDLQVPEAISERYASWKIEDMPWDRSQMAWERIVIESSRDVFEAAEAAVRALKTGDEVVIATDLDPSGEGELLAWEFLDAIGYDGPVSRMRQADETPDPVRRAFREREPITREADGDLFMALARDKWDFCSMQLTRVATTLARSRGHKALIRQGRLKSVIVSEVGKQLKAHAEYKKVPFYEVRYKDEAGNVFLRKDAEDAGLRFASKDECSLDGHDRCTVIVEGRTRKKKAPPKLLDLAGLAAILAKQGADPAEVLDTYQKLYEAGIVSYPRTEDKHVTPEQFSELLPLTERIAQAVGVDASLLTHREPRDAHVKAGGAHGANRPGLNVPANAEELKPYGKSAAAIYETLAKSWLAILAPDAEYDQVKAHLEERPVYASTASICKVLGFREVFDADAALDDADEEGAEFGESADPYIHEGANKRPPAPTMAWLKRRLERFDVGTGATRTSTLTDISDGSERALIIQDRGKLTLTEPGAISLFLLDGCRIADPEETARLFADMKRVGAFEISEEELLRGFDALLAHDMARMAENAKTLKQGTGGSVEVGACPRCGKPVVSRGRAFACSSNKAEKRDDGTYEDIAGCGFKILPFSGRALSAEQAKRILTGRKVAMRGLTSRNTGNKYDCDLVLDAASESGIRPVFKTNKPTKQPRRGRRG